MRHKRKPHKRQATGISIHAPLAGCDGLQEKQRGTHLKFQSTHPLRGATASPKSAHIRHLHFNPHFNPRTPCGVRPRGILRDAAIPDISIHAPLGGCDDGICAAQEVGKDFNPRTPCGVRRRRTRQQGNGYQFQSTHPLRGATRRNAAKLYRDKYFNPRTPCGVRHALSRSRTGTSRFQSTHPLRGATEHSQQVLNGIFISIHAPLAGCDRICDEFAQVFYHLFQSTHPLRGATK